MAQKLMEILCIKKVNYLLNKVKMNRIKWILLAVVMTVVCCSILIQFTIGFPLVISTSDLKTNISKYESGDTIQLLENCNFDEGRWSAYIVFNWEDNSKSKMALPFKVYKTDNIDVLKKMKKEWVFQCTGGDMATIQSEILFFQDGKLIYRSNIVLEKDFEGFQSPQCGWISKKGSIIYKYCKEFKPVWFPIVIL